MSHSDLILSKNETILSVIIIMINYKILKRESEKIDCVTHLRLMKKYSSILSCGIDKIWCEIEKYINREEEEEIIDDVEKERAIGEKIRRFVTSNIVKSEVHK